MQSFSLCLSRTEEKQSERKKYSFPSPQSPPEAKGEFFQSLLKDPAFLFFSTASASIYPPLLCASPWFRHPVPANFPVCAKP